MFKSIALVSVSALLLAGCASAPKNTGAYQKVTLPDAEVMPTPAQLKGERTKVLILSAQDQHIKDARATRTGEQIAAALEKGLMTTSVEVVDRSVAKQFEKEIRLAEMQNQGNYKGPSVADYAISGKVASAALTGTFTEGSTYQNKDGSITTRAPTCDYKAKLMANMRIYQMPGLSFVKALSLEGSSSETQDATSRDCKFSAGLKSKLVAKASEDATQRINNELKNFFAPSAYVLDRRELEDDVLFRISQGNRNGFMIDGTVTLYKFEQEDDELSKHRLGTAKIVDANDKNAWLELGQDSYASLVKRGHLVQANYKVSMGDTAKVLFRKVKDALGEMSGGSRVTGGNLLSSFAGGGASGGGAMSAPVSGGAIYAGNVSADAELIEATWRSTASNYKGRLGQDFRYICPSNGSTSRIYGGLHNKYSVSSSVCTAAVYVGLISVKHGGTVSIRILDNKDGFPAGQKRNGIQPRKTNSTRGFVFLK